jgi:hypothetical protein
MPYSEEEKELLKKYRNLVKVTQPIPRKTKLISKQGAQKLLEFIHDPNYNLYVEAATELVNSQKQALLEKLNHFPQNLRDIDLTDIIEEYHQEYKVEMWPAPADIRKANKELLKQKEHESQSAYDKFYNIAREFSEQDKQLLQGIFDIKTRLREVEDWCVLTPDVKVEELVTTDCNFSHGLNNFIYEFEDKLKEGKKQQVKQQKQQEWQKKIISSSALEKYHNILQEQIAENTEVLNDLFTQHAGALRQFTEAYVEFKKKPAPKAPTLLGWEEGYASEWDKYSKEYERYKLIASELAPAQKYWDVNTKQLKEDVIEQDAWQEAQFSVEEFVTKNVDKLATILTKRSDCNDIDFNLETKSGRVIGNFTFSCENGDSFRVKNKIVSQRSSHGKPFYQFPTTFHGVKWDDESKEFVSEQWMNKKFVQKG